MRRLIIDTADNKELKVGIDDNISSFKQTEASLKAEDSLDKIESILQKENIKLSDIEEIKVNRGPGSFTGLKVGCAIANALAFSLAVSVNNKPLGEMESPQYS